MNHDFPDLSIVSLATPVDLVILPIRIKNLFSFSKDKKKNFRDIMFEEIIDVASIIIENIRVIFKYI
jgi:hypothetical protein